MSLVHLIKHSKNQNPDTEVVFDSNDIQSLIKDHIIFGYHILINLTDDREVEIKLSKETEKSFNYSLIEFTALWQELLCRYKGQDTELVETLKFCGLKFKRCKTVDVSLSEPDYNFGFYIADK